MENIIIYKAIEVLEKTTTARAEWIPAMIPKTMLDGQLVLRNGNKEYRFTTDLKKNVQIVNLPAFGILKKAHKNLIIIAETIYPNIREQLRARQINYLDTAGNLFICQGELFLYIEGRKTGKPIREPHGRAFNKAGLKFIFHLLTEKDFLAGKYQAMAEKCETGIANIYYIINDLERQDFLCKGPDKTWVLQRREDLLREWVRHYEQKLKPAYWMGNYRFQRENDMKRWKELDLDFAQTKWGGEPAADILTNYLDPGVLTLYTREKRLDLIKKLRILPDDNGNIRMYNLILGEEAAETKTVHPLIIYADLVNTLNPRTDELANMIYNEYLKNQL
ncbi:MAG: type IV toxin-antitoxin system AbiEi family antitoxin [Bacteroidales bacterium]